MKKLFAALLAIGLAIGLVGDPADARRVKHGKHHVSQTHRKHVKKPRRQAAVTAIVRINISLATQTMSVTVNGANVGHWPISSGKRGFATPRGNYRVGRMARHYFSKKYDNAPMPYAMFFRGGYAIHGTNHVRALGRPASHGCIRLHTANAARLFALVARHGGRRTAVSIH